MGSVRVPEAVPSAEQDCLKLRKAFQGFGTDEEAVIRVLGHRNASQRRQITNSYQRLYNKSLVDDLNSQLSGDFRDAVTLWSYDPPERDAKLVRDALRQKKKGIQQFKALVEIACASSPHHLMAATQFYCSVFECSLEEDIASHISLPLRKLRQTFRCYKQTYGTSIYQDIRSCGSGDLESLLNLVINGSVVGLGTDEATLNRAIISRAEIDMMKIKRGVFQTFQKQLGR